jgi:Kef-type K+ transport system membrane component KefB
MEAPAQAAVVVFLVFTASLISVETALAVSIIEIAAGVFAGNVLGMQSAPWMDFLAQFGGILLTFLAGTEIDRALMRSKLKESVLIGGISFLLPFLTAAAFTFFVAHWTRDAALIAGVALSTTSLAVVYSVLVETGLSTTELGKLLMASTFVTDMGTAVALSLLFARPVPATAAFFGVAAVLVVLAPRLLPPLFERYGGRVIEPEIKLLFFLLFGLMFLAHIGRSHAVLPAFVLGLALAPMFQLHAELRRKLRIVSFAMITPFFFLKGGMNLSLAALQTQLVLLLVLLGVKLAAKALGVLPLARRHIPGAAVYTTLLMSTGLTFGTISATYGLEHGYINQEQFSLLVAVVILSAIVPTFIAQRWFAPRLSPEEQEEMLSRAEESL